MKRVPYWLAAAGLLTLTACGDTGANNASGNIGAVNETAPLTGDLNSTTPSTVPPVNTGGARIDTGENVTTTNTATNTTGN